MSKNRDINIHGNGNLIGDNNQVTLNQNTYNTRIQHSNHGANRDDGGPAIFAIPIGVLILISIAVWKFANYAETIYNIAIVTAAALVTTQALALLIGLLKKINNRWLYQRLIALASGIFTFFAIHLSKSSYPQKLSTLAAEATDGLDFMCNLSLYGHQVSTYHMVSISGLAIPALFFLLINSFSALLASTYFVAGWSWTKGLAVIFNARWVLICATVFSGAAYLSQSSTAEKLWQSHIITESHDPFLKGKNSLLCR
ncbi:hypothetical protein [Pseudomonas chlororaphis]|uniref:hypothetical protein n=1 Tax=Pseudomonas chlororaphis TaxID=587753 RepID=UPI00048A6645|nr:hypothetical protein [Pseudomonas chlororaphis]